MSFAALRGALGFCTRLPVGRDAAAWDAFLDGPAVLPLVGWLVGPILALPLVVPGPAPTVAAALVVWTYLLSGLAHLDGLADVGDAAATVGSAEERRAVMTDAAVGAGGALAVGAALVALALAALALADLPLAGAVITLVVAEVAAKLAVVGVAVLGRPSHEGIGERVVVGAGRRTVVVALALASPAFLVGGWGRLVGAGRPGALLGAGEHGVVGAGLAWFGTLPPVGLVALASAGVVTLLAVRWSRTRLGGVGGDVLGATNEVTRVVALHAGVVAWTLW